MGVLNGRVIASLDSVARISQDDDAGGPMSRYAVAHLDEIDEISDGRCPSRPIRHHFGITSFGVNAWTGREAGDRIINEHDEGGDDGDEELYLVQRGRARFELDGEPVQAPVGTLVFVGPVSSVRRSPRSRGRRSLPSAARRGRRTNPVVSRSGRRSDRSTRQASTPRPLTEAVS
jgi:mannose-6-phosphate isomerase-like protein (cupin superfamily)